MKDELVGFSYGLGRGLVRINANILGPNVVLDSLL